MLQRHTPSGPDCLGRTCLQWQSNGELSDQDLSLVLQRLQAAETKAQTKDDGLNAISA